MTPSWSRSGQPLVPALPGVNTPASSGQASSLSRMPSLSRSGLTSGAQASRNRKRKSGVPGSRSMPVPTAAPSCSAPAIRYCAPNSSSIELTEESTVRGPATTVVMASSGPTWSRFSPSV